jgi:hypothetical protein
VYWFTSAFYVIILLLHMYLAVYQSYRNQNWHILLPHTPGTAVFFCLHFLLLFSCIGAVLLRLWAPHLIRTVGLWYFALHLNIIPSLFTNECQSFFLTGKLTPLLPKTFFTGNTTAWIDLLLLLTLVISAWFVESLPRHTKPRLNHPLRPKRPERILLIVILLQFLLLGSRALTFCLWRTIPAWAENCSALLMLIGTLIIMICQTRIPHYFPAVSAMCLPVIILFLPLLTQAKPYIPSFGVSSSSFFHPLDISQALDLLLLWMPVLLLALLSIFHPKIPGFWRLGALLVPVIFLVLLQYTPYLFPQSFHPDEIFLFFKNLIPS